MKLTTQEIIALTLVYAGCDESPVGEIITDDVYSTLIDKGLATVDTTEDEEFQGTEHTVWDGFNLELTEEGEMILEDLAASDLPPDDTSSII